ncbi:MAG: PTS sugar transporter subunit IIB [Anaerolineaceae bacterium]|jgi:PTS system galactitol-specific IIB component|nr:PTS sugar transporter subunit IIB [Anaerolineaceae bacterium]
MGKQKTILVACGTGIATSTMAAKAIESAMEERGIDVIIRQCKTAEIMGRLNGVNVLVTTTSFSSDIGVPIIRTLAFLTGIGKEEAIDQIIAALEACDK